ncbi:MAG: amidoligase family protein [Paludibacteraceae bacterium]|nr:amidoligase family protein [Paludibacteraceae bacterium]
MELCRTIGFELEVANVDKSKVTLPEGYSWSEDETIVNTNGKIVKSRTSLFGGELNTRPMSLCQSDRDEFRNVVKQIFENGGRNTWNKGFDGHIYAGDLSIDQLKNVFLLSYYTSVFIKEYADMGGWLEYSTQAPTPTLEFVKKVRCSTNFSELENVFANSSVKGYVRHIINITSYYKHKTIEFRIFNPTEDFADIEASALFMFRFLNYAISHTEEDFKQIGTMDDFKRELKLHYPLAKKIAPLIFSGDQTSERDRTVSRAYPLSSPIIKMIVEESDDELAIVNPFLYSSELSLYKRKKLTIYNSDELNHIIYLLAIGDLRLKYNGKFSFFEDYNSSDAETQLSLLFIMHRLKNYLSESEFDRNTLEAYKAKLPESIEKLRSVSSELVKMFSQCRYVNGTVEDAIENEKCIFWQYNNNSKARSTVFFVRKYTNYDLEYEERLPDYYNLLERLSGEQHFLMVSANEYLPLKKIGKKGKQFFYSNKDSKKVITTSTEAYKNVSVLVPPDDLSINDVKLLKIAQFAPKDFIEIQRLFVKKVDKVSIANVAFLVMYDKYCLGGFAFSFPKDRSYDLWLLSDFATNNKVYRLSKLILLCIKSELTKKALQRYMKRSVETIYTKAYTTNPVSMKYRGLFNKVKLDEPKKYLKYETVLGTCGNAAQIIDEYQKIIKR